MQRLAWLDSARCCAFAGLPSRVRKVRVLHTSAYALSRVYVHTEVTGEKRGPVSRVDNGGRHAETRTATVLRLCLRSAARANVRDTSSAFSLLAISTQRSTLIFSRN